MSNAPTKSTADDVPEIDLSDPRWKSLGRGRGARRELVLPLAGMRKASGKTQVEVAEALGTDQGEVSRMERRDNLLLSTLQRYAEALGAKAEIAFVFKTGARVVLEVK